MAGYKRQRTNVGSKKKSGKKVLSVSQGPTWSIQNGVRMPGFSAMSKTYRTTMRYRDQLVSLNPGIGGLAASHVFTVNGLYDPDITGVGHQPAGFDQIMEFYDHYCVTYARITCTFTNLDANNSQTVAIYTSDAGATFTDIRIPIENGDCTFTELDTLGSALGQKTLTHTCDVKRYMGRRAIIDDATLQGNNAANPSDGLFFVLTAAPQASVDSSQVVVQTTIEYVTTFLERRRVNIS